jgi:hypothetical protein
MQTPQTTKARASGPLSWITSPEKGTPGVEVTFRLLEGPDKDATIRWVGWLSDSTVSRTQESLGLMGYDGDRDESIQGNEVNLVIEDEEYPKKDGSTGRRPRVRWVNSLSGGGGFEPMSAAQISGAKERLKAAALAAKSKKPAAPAAEEPQF